MSKRTPFATLGKAQQMVTAGDVVYILPGTFKVSEEEIQAEESSGPYKIVYQMDMNGTYGNPISFIGIPDENGQRPVFDLSEVKPEGYRVTAFHVTGSYLIFRNFEVVGIQINRTDHTQSENFRITNGRNNTFENIACHDGMGIGFYLHKSSAYNLIVNCDGYNNYDPISDVQEKTGMGSGGNNDGFGCHVQKNCPNNIFIGCRAWNNADDGYDLISCSSATVFCYSFAYKNGYDANNISRGDGNGFKAGGYGMSKTSAVNDVTMDEVPMHTVHHCIAVQNKANGIYSNHHLGGLHFHDNTSYKNSNYNYSLVNRQGTSIDEAVDVNGYGHILERNLSVVDGAKTNHITWLDGGEGLNIITDNSFWWETKGNYGGWNYTKYGPSVFVSSKVSDMLADRYPDGMLSETTLNYMKQIVWLGYGCSFEKYSEAISDMRTISGAEAAPVPTTISSIKRCEDEQNVYNLQGRRVTQPTRGIYICGGKKIIIR